MAYKVSYEERSPVWSHERVPVRTETFHTENAALDRARQLLERDVHSPVTIRDDTGETVAGIRLQLKLGYPVA